MCEGMLQSTFHAQLSFLLSGPLPSVRVCSFKNTERSYKGMLAYDTDVALLSEQVSRLQEDLEGRTNSEIRELKRKIQEVGERVGSIASHMDQEERVQELEKRVEEQDREIASLKDKLERVLATLECKPSDT